MKKLIMMGLVAALIGCAPDSQELQVTEPPVPDMEWVNIAVVDDTLVYSPLNITVNDVIEFGLIGTTVDATCSIVWVTTSTSVAGCRNIVNDGPWPITCTNDGLSCVVNSIPVYYLLSLGGSRTLTPAEATLVSTMRSLTYCTASRIDGSPPPCPEA